MKQIFNQILDDLGKELGLSLFQDRHGVCELDLHHRLRIQLFYNASQELLTLASFLSDLPPGVYRERLLQALLKVNGTSRREGTFAYSSRNNKIVFFTYVYPPFNSGELIFEAIERFVKNALPWKESIEKGTPFPEGEEKISRPPPPFRSA